MPDWEEQPVNKPNDGNFCHYLPLKILRLDGLSNEKDKIVLIEDTVASSFLC
jgi:hypothetical protein